MPATVLFFFSCRMSQKSIFSGILHCSQKKLTNLYSNVPVASRSKRKEETAKKKEDEPENLEVLLAKA